MRPSPFWFAEGGRRRMTERPSFQEWLRSGVQGLRKMLSARTAQAILLIALIVLGVNVLPESIPEWAGLPTLLIAFFIFVYAMYLLDTDLDYRRKEDG